MQRGQVRVEHPLTSAPEMPPDTTASYNEISALSSVATHEKTVRLGTLESPFLVLLKHWSKPTVVIAALWICMLFCAHRATRADWVLALVTILISRQVFSPLQLLSANSPHRTQVRLTRLLLQWSAVVAALLFLGFALKLGDAFPHRLLLSWFALTPITLLIGDLCSTRLTLRIGSAHQRYIIVGANDVGVELQRRVADGVGMGTFMGFFDFRSPDRLPTHARGHFAGQCKDVAAFVGQHAVNAIYIALPMSNAPRIEEMLLQFRDTTASIYFVQDIFAFDLVQARCVEINGIPMLSICDTPFHGMNAMTKRCSDIVLASLALLLTWPLMLATAIALRLSSPGPALFKQRRYGLHGEEIVVYKFRTMTVCEDGPMVVQAKKQDARITAIGRILRRTSLDELPQLLNVLRGEMSIIGPRPHAVAHNELYRKLISGYMIRHKIRPGMTGWAQVHGLRGETAIIEQMRLRVQYDLDYLRHWSLWLDLKILFKTALIVMVGRNAD
jgi:putative colanic acid biosysnthesis UDP-glucose lipid carrier transferase